MQKQALTTNTSKISTPAAFLAIAAAAATLLFLLGLHALSPEFDPSWRMVSEYASGQHGWLLSLMFAAWAISSWALAFALASQLNTAIGKIGLGFLILAGIGQAMAVVFDISNSLHGLAAFIGIGGLTIAAMIISLALVRTQPWAAAKTSLLFTANLTWVSVILMAITFIILIVTYTQAGGDMTSTEVPTALPAGVIALVGWANRLLIVVDCVWVITAAWQALQLRRPIVSPVVTQ